MREDHDPADIAHWPEEFLALGDDSEKEIWSLASVENGLKSTDLGPLACHLRSGFLLPLRIAEMLADAIDRNPEAVCSITASRPTVGNPHNGGGHLHSRNMAIGFEYTSKVRAAKRGEAKGIKADLAKQFSVSVSTVRSAIAYFHDWPKKLSE